MRRRIRLATVGALAVAAIAALSSTAGAAGTAPTYSTSANGGFISLSLLNLIGLTGAGSSANASSAGTDSASGTGLCATLSESATTCPTTTDANSSDVLNTTANATASSASPGTDAPAPNCLIPPTTLLIITLEAACGRASATETSTGLPTASGEGDLAQVNVSLGAALPSLSGLLGNGILGGILGNGALCSSSTSAGNTATTSTNSGLVSGLLGTVNSLLGGLSLAPLSSSTDGGALNLGSVCGILSGLTSELPIVGSLLSNASASTNLLSITVGQSTSTITNSVAAAGALTGDESVGDQLVTTTATTEGVDVNLLNMLDIKILPNTASVTVDTTTGQVQQPSAVTGIISVQEGSSVPTTLALPDLSSIITNLLGSLGNTLVNPQLTTIAESATTLSPDGTSGTAEAADLKLDLLGGLVVLNLGDAKVAASTATAAPLITPVVTQPAVATPVVTSAAVVPNVTTVHTGEFWAGTLPIFLVSGMGLAGILLIARRRVFSVARSLVPMGHHVHGGPPPGPASGTSSVPPPVSGPARRQSPH
jgi:hypothetical protein